LLTRIVTHNDFDGIVSGALVSYFLNIDTFYFTGPRSVNNARFPISSSDVVCDLPYPLECGMWFDHHPGNFEELNLRGIDPEKIEGAFAPLKSCARVVLNYFEKMSDKIPSHFKDTVDYADIIDAFDYKSIDEWRKETPAKIIDGALKSGNFAARGSDFMKNVVLSVRDHGLDFTSEMPDVVEKWEKYCSREENMMKMISNDSYFLSEDSGHELLIVDLTKHNRKPEIFKNLAYVLYPEIKGVLEIKNIFSRGVKTNNLSVSISLNLNKDSANYDTGLIMRTLNIGDGHKGAAAGVVNCSSKQEMSAEKKNILQNIFKLWREQNGAGV